ncbi:MAG: hypothetical protein AB8B58_02635 [Roseobacter sp.]
MQNPDDPDNKDNTGYYGSERDGRFPEITTLPAQNPVSVMPDLSDAERAMFSSSYSTAEGVLART